MTAMTFSHLPLAAGSAVAASVGRAGLWVLARYMRAPLASTGMMAMVTLTALAASNALYFQPGHHPAPFFSSGQSAPVASVAPVVAPVVRPVLPPVVAPQTSADTTGGIAPQPVRVPDAPVGNRDAFAVQKKLTELGFFNGTVDGFYGPMTANAIRAFEEKHGYEPTGALTPAVVDAILHADAAGMVPAVQQTAQAVAVAPRPAPAPIAPVAVAPVRQAAIEPPAPVPASARLPALTPVDATVDTVGTAAADTIDSILAAVSGTAPAQAESPRPPVALASATQPLPKPVQVASIEPMTVAPAPTPAPAAEPAPKAAAVASNLAPANDAKLVSQIQRGLASLGFYHGSIDGRPGDTTARAIREFENFNSYKLTGQVNPDLVQLLRNAGASI